MTTTEVGPVDGMAAIRDMVLSACQSPATKRNYQAALDEFLPWLRAYMAAEPGRAFNKAAVGAYRDMLHAAGKGAASINLKLSAVRKLAREAADNNMIPEAIAAGIGRAEGVPQRGTRAGNWLTKAQAQCLLDAPDTSTLIGLRDRALLAVMLGCGLRRKECAGLTFAHLQQREGRWAIVDMIGKRSKMRTVPMPGWCKLAIDRWTLAAGIADGRIFRQLRKGGHMADAPALSDQAVYYCVERYAKLCGCTGALAAHDLRRTFAKLAMKGGASLEQVSLNLGHDSLTTTQKYLGLELDYQNAPGDFVGLTVESA